MQHQARFQSRSLRQIFAVVFTVAILAAQHTAAIGAKPVTGRWHNDFAQAGAEAKRLNKPLLVHFYADWCLPCQRMQRESLSNPVLLQQLGRQIVGVKVNFDRQPALARRFNIRTLPGDIILAPDGTLLARSNGYRPLRRYFQQIAAANVRFAKSVRSVPAIATRPNNTGSGRNGPSRRPVIVARPASRGRRRAVAPVFRKPVWVPKPPLGMDGYNPIALYKRRQWQKGRAKFAARYQGIEYRVNSAAELRQFLTTPERFAPQLLGCDPVVLQETDRALNGGTKHAAYFDGRLYLFINTQTRAKFKQHPLRYTRTEHVLLLDDESVTKRTLRR